MTVPVTYYCPHCGTIVTVERDEYLADRSVTPYPLDGWVYVSPDGDYENADGIEFRCADCGRNFYLNFVKFERGVEVVPEPSRADGRR